MGLLSDPSLAPRNKLGLSLSRHMKKIGFLFYIAGLVWFVCLSHSDFNHSTYLSENALSPGLVYPEIRIESNRLAVTLHEELLREQEQHKSTTPHAWIAAKMRQFGLETYIHNFTLRYPYSNGKEFQGKNIYGILRAPRIGSTEGIVFSAPYRAATSMHTDISASVPVLLAFAEFARRKNYWAKDLIFLVTEQEQLGMQAWLEAYHKGDREPKPNAILRYGSLPARAGALQAALNLEIQDLEIDYIDVKIEGLNGKLPNLDMFNLVQRITSREGITSGYKQTPRKRRRSTYASTEQNLYNMVSMMASQALGVPNGNHGLFLRYRIEALTIEAVKRVTNTKTGRNSAAIPLLKTIEGISRSLNNLLERFHQSFFFYIIVHNDRYISIGDYMPCLIALAAGLFIKAFLTWISLCNNYVNDEEDEHLCDADAISNTTDSSDMLENVDETETADSTKGNKKDMSYITVLLYVGVILLLGYLCNVLPVHPYVINLSLSSSTVIATVLGTTSLIGILMPFVVPLPFDGLDLLHIGFLIFLGVTLIVIGLLNFALGFFVAIVAVPLAISMDTNVRYASVRQLTRIYALFLNPLLFVYVIVLVLTFQQFPELLLKELIIRAFNATIDAVTYAFMDSLIYGNWLYIAATIVFLPAWMVCWTISVLQRDGSKEITKLKTN